MGSRATNRLTDRGIKAWIQKARAGQKYADGGGMFLTITPAGTAVWRLKFRFNRKERLFSIGTYSSMTLEQARAAREVARAQLREGRDPVMARRLERAASAAATENTFGAVTRDWLNRQKPEWSDIHYTKSVRALERDVLPHLAKLPVGEISTPMISAIVESITRRGARDTAAKVLWHCCSIFRLTQARGLCTTNPAEPVRELLAKKKKTRRMPAVLDFAGLGEILRRARAAGLSAAVHMAHRLCAFTAARISNIVEAEWSEFALDASPAAWVIPRRKMKAQDREHDHKIILPTPMVSELRQWSRITAGRGYVFPSRSKGAHITRESLEKAYRVTLALEGKHTPHGWRAAFSTLARDGGFERDAVELALDHVHDNDVARAYDRGERLSQRIRLAQWWGEQLLHAENGADVIRIRRAAEAS